ncbi:hypothetical protein ACFFWC_00265 [Plantactinospora siamensis]|uniref:Uncharacterized protein n=1 Tax=Plantactinospora siamensis TaxID=555372 RepID=A0ABV6NTU5_9ACTN
MTTTRAGAAAAVRPPRDRGVAPARSSSAVLAWALGYGGLRLVWAVGAAPAFPGSSRDIAATHALVAGLAGAAALVAAAQRRARWSWPFGLAGWAVAGGLLATAPMLLLDLVGLVIPGLGLPFDPGSFLTRLGVAGGAVLLGRATLDHRRRRGPGCPRCGRTAGDRPAAGPPWWAWAGAYAAVAGCLVRLAAQLAVGFDMIPLTAGPAVLVFEGGFLLAGLLLPLALVHSWGRIWPRWAGPLAGRRVPRWLVLGPAYVLATGLVVYFGVGLGQLTVAAVRGEEPGLGLPYAFYWVAMPAYWIWGLGLGAAALAYARSTRPPCPHCEPEPRPPALVDRPPRTRPGPPGLIKRCASGSTPSPTQGS